MHNKLAIFAFAAIVTLAACGGGGGGGSINPGGSMAPTAPPGGVGPDTIGISLPTTSIGSVNDPTFGEVGGYTQNTYSQTLAFPVGTVVTLKNLSSTTTHTFNVVSTTSFPASPTLSTAASGGTTLSSNFASGNIAPNGTMQITLSNAGTFYFGCAYHYLNTPQMRDVIQVSNTATPGPQATPGSTTGCTGYYC